MASGSLSIRGIFKCLMENGYYPSYEKTHIFFDFEENTGVVEYEEGVVSVRIFFSIEPDTYRMFTDASNSAMSLSYGVKPVVTEDRKSIMFSCEFLCDTEREFRKFFPRSLEMLREGLAVHKAEMKKMILAERLAATNIPAADEASSLAGTSKTRKSFS